MFDKENITCRCDARQPERLHVVESEGKPSQIRPIPSHQQKNNLIENLTCRCDARQPERLHVVESEGEPSQIRPIPSHQQKNNLIENLTCRCDGIGRRARLKILCRKLRAGSTPAIGN